MSSEWNLSNGLRVRLMPELKRKSAFRWNNKIVPCRTKQKQRTIVLRDSAPVLAEDTSFSDDNDNDGDVTLSGINSRR